MRGVNVLFIVFGLILVYLLLVPPKQGATSKVLAASGRDVGSIFQVLQGR